MKKDINTSRKGALPSSEELENWVDNYDVMTMYHVSQRTLQSLRSNGQLPYTIFANRCFYRKVDVQALFKSRYRKGVAKAKTKMVKSRNVVGNTNTNSNKEDKPCQ